MLNPNPNPRLRLLDMLSVRMVMIWSSKVWQRRLRRLDRGDAREKTWWACVKDDMKSFGLSCEDAENR